MQQDYKTLAIYVLTLFVVVLLIVLKKQQDHLTELESEVVETELPKVYPDSLKEKPAEAEDFEITQIPMRGVIGIIIDDLSLIHI